MARPSTRGRRPGWPAARPGRRSGLRRIARWVLGVLFALGFVVGIPVGTHVARLDQEVVARFHGRLFRVASRVLSAPTILYPGLDWKRIELRDTLARLGYQESAAATLEAGRYHWTRDRLLIHLRAFDHPTRPEPERQVELVLDGTQIEEIHDAASGRELGAVMLEPETVGSYYGPDREQRELVRLGEVPRSLIDAILAVEDKRFDEHHGIDPIRILGAAFANLRAGGIAQGGSTLTQQLVKNFFLTPRQTLSRKLNEAVMALLVEARYGKDEILECYLNEIYLGQRGSIEVHGVGEAARLYFGKPVRDLDLAESALLAAIIPRPNGLSPYRAGDAAVARRNMVLDLMQQQGRIDTASHDAAMAEPLRLSKVTPEASDARYFLDALRRQLPESYDYDALSSEGLRIYSTLDQRLQRIAARSLRSGLEELEKRYPRLRVKEGQEPLQACILVLRPQTGEVLAMVGGRDYGSSQFNRCTQARRQAGSVFKPFVYVAALEPHQGRPPAITLASFLDDEPLSIATPSGSWEPENYDRRFHGIVPVRTALADSMNVATARLAQQVGLEQVVDVAHRLGIESPLELVPSLALGVADLSPLEVARAYATLANGGIRPEIRTFEDIVGSEGHVLDRRDIGFERVLDAGTAYLATELMEGVVDFGTAASIRSAGLRGPIAGKTGTTNETKDAWFAGFTPELTVVVWVGFDTPRSIGLTGAAAALPIWIRFLAEATGGEVRGAFLPPPEVIEVEVDPSTGAVALAGCPASRPEHFLLGTEPTRTCPEGGYYEPAPAPAERAATPPPPRRPGGRRRGLFDWLRDVL